MPLDLPAHALLKLAGETDIAWAVFDPDWYRAAHADARAALEAAEPGAVLAWYLEHGQKRGHAPNLFFDEAWHRAAYPGIAALVRDGRVASAFDAYCRGGTARSPHWLFDEPLYRRRHGDLGEDVLQANGLANGYDHFLRHGALEGRIGHALFDPGYVLQALAPGEAAQARAAGPFRHYLQRLAQHAETAGGDTAAMPEPRTSPFFDPAWYLQRYPEVATQLRSGAWRGALHHYLCNDTPSAFDPLPEFSEAFYLHRNPGVAETVQRHEQRSGYAHFLVYGAEELRAPCAAIDLRWYAAQPQVRDDLDQGQAPHAFAHWLLIGRAQGLLPAPPPEERLSEALSRTVFHRKAALMAPLFGRAPLDFTCGDAPAVSVVMVVRDALPQTLAALAALRDNLAGDLELILVDSGSADETRHLGRYVRGAQVLRFDSNLGALRGANAALPCLRGAATLLLQPDVELVSGAVAAALRCLDADPRIGAVGGKLVRAHGALDSAGGIVWRDATAQPYLPDASPLLPEANFRRDVDFCPRAFLLLRTALLQQLAGFDVAFDGTGQEDVDLCLRVQEAGYRVVYEPAAALYNLLERHVPATGPAAPALAARHAETLARRPANDPAALVSARHAGPQPRRVLFIEDMLPLRMLGSGFVRSNDLIQTMAAAGYGVTVYPVAPNRCELAAVYADMPETVEVMHDRALDGLRDFLQRRTGYYDTIWIARTHNLDRVQPILQRVLPQDGSAPRVVLDTEAIASLRQEGRAALTGAAFDRDAALRREFANAALCRAVVAVTEREAATLRALGCADVAVIGHRREPHPTPRSFAQRAGVLFIGAMHQQDSPNFDSLCWFVDQVLPLVERSLRWETRLTVVGHTARDVTLERFRDHPRITLCGAVADTVPLYNAHRLFVAPTRFAAGTPYKVHEAASFGLPVVATELLRDQLGWADGEALLSAPGDDPVAFAAAVVRLYRDAALWQRLRDAALQRLRQENGAAAYTQAVAAVLGPVARLPDAGGAGGAGAGDAGAGGAGMMGDP
jgi:glycosyltransferase involved in cell wall biosynthesis